ncbi:MAG: hypothetical protein NC305_18795 [Lachnospiraceae bacterium]|nr:hypothetical protein [Lachnospiraceae bacterium]
MKEWKEEHCAVRPDELQLIAQDTYIQRRDIREVSHEETDGMPAYTEYVCESREIGVSEYEMLKSIENISTQEAIDNYTLQLIEEGVM